MERNPRAVIIAAGLVLILVALLTYSGLVFLSSGVFPWHDSSPPLWAPMAGLIFWPSYIGLLTLPEFWPLRILGVNFYFALFSLIPILLASLFWITGRALFHGEMNAPRWLVLVTLVVGVLNVAYVVAIWENALAVHGLAHLVVVIAQNIVLFGAIFVLYSLTRRRPSFGGNLFCHWLFYFWLVWCAFPWLGGLFGDTL
jgi:hypothetical protein